MQMKIRAMTEDDRDAVLDMMRLFYTSAAVHTNGSEEIFLADVLGCVGDNPYLDGYILEGEGDILGYAMVAKSFSTEFGKPCFWIEDLYIKEAYRGAGLGKRVLDFITGCYTDGIFRLEVEPENERAVRLYEKCGFSVLPYMEMKK